MKVTFPLLKSILETSKVLSNHCFEYIKGSAEAVTWMCSVKKKVLKNFIKFTGETPVSEYLF